MDATERAPLMGPGPLSDGQFYSPPESVADSDEELDDKHDPEKGSFSGDLTGSPPPEVVKCFSCSCRATEGKKILPYTFCHFSF